LQEDEVACSDHRECWKARGLRGRAGLCPGSGSVRQCTKFERAIEAGDQECGAPGHDEKINKPRRGAQNFHGERGPVERDKTKHSSHRSSPDACFAQG
jgi:hypothetical protein